MALREDLELDISSAVGQIDQLGARLDQAASTFGVALADALGVLDSVQIEDVDASAVSTSIEDAISEGESEPVDLTVDADTSEAQGQIDELDGETVEVDVEVDTGAAQAELDGLAGSAGGVGDASAQASEGVDDLDLSVAGLSGSTLAAVGGIAGLVAGVTNLFQSGLTAASSLESFNARLGDLAPTIESVEIGGLSTTIGQLAQDLGSSDEAVRGSIARLVEFGDAAGATDAQLEQTSDQFLALAARAVSLNPELGDIGDVVTQLQGGLSRGGRRLAAYGIELTAVEIEARALANTGKLTNTELTEFDKAAAGAQLAAEQLGDSLTGDIQTGTQNVALNFESLKQVFGDTVEDLGKPLIAPILDLLEAGLPIATTLFEVLATVAAAVIPAITGILDGILPLIDALAGPLSEVFEQIGPSLEQLGIALGDLLAAFAPVLTSVAEGLGSILLVASPIIDLLALIAEGASLLVTALLNLPGVTGFISALVSPLSAVGNAIGSVTSGFGAFGDDSRDLEPVIAELEQSILGEVETIADLAAALDDVTGGIEAFFDSTDSKIIEDFSDELAQAGVTTAELAELFQQGESGAQQLGTRLAEAGVDGATLENGLVTLSGSALDLVETLKEEQGALTGVGQETLNQLVLSGQLTAEQLQAVKTTNTLTDGTVDYSGALRDAVIVTGETSDALADQAPRLADQAQAWTDLAEDIANGSVTTADYSAISEQLGVDLTVVEGFADAVSAKLDAFAQAAISTLPTVSSALEGLEDASDPQALIDNLNEQTAAIANFQANLTFLESLGESADAIFALAVENGPVFTNELIKGLREGGPEVAAELEASLEAFETQTGETSAFLTGVATPALVDATATAAGAVSDVYRDDLDFSTATTAEIDAAVAVVAAGTPSLEELTAIMGADAATAYLEQLVLAETTGTAVDAAGTAIVDATPGLETDAEAAGAATATGFESGADFADGVRTKAALARAEVQAVGALVSPAAIQAGRDVGEAFGDGIELGIALSLSGIIAAARQAVVVAETAARAEARSQSPSKLFAELGEDLGMGIAEGLDTANQDVVRAAEAIVSDAAAQLDTATVGGGGVAGGGGGGISVGSIDVEVVFQGQGGTRADGLAVGTAIGDGIALRLEALAERGVVVGARIAGA